MNFFFFNLMEDWRQFWKRLFGAGRPVGETRRLYVGNLSYSAKEEDVKALFTGQSRVSDVHLIRDRFTRKPKGYAFVEVAKEDAQKALSLSGTDFMGRKLVVSEAKSRHNASGGSGGGPRRHKEHDPKRGPRGRRRPNKGPRTFRPGPQAPKDSQAQVERLE